jgi:hypothetical protein
MKTTILLVFLFILITKSTYGQKFSFENSSIIKSAEITKSFSGYGKTDTILKLFPNLDLFHRRNKRNFDLDNDRSIEDFEIVKNNPPYAVAEEFPGSSKFYAKRPSLSHIPGEENFILKPDTASKYYLLIREPNERLIPWK